MRRILDWKFLVALTMAMMVGYLVWVGIVATQETARKGHRIDTLIQTVQREQADADAAQDAATLERDQLLDNQRAMLARMRSMEHELRALRHWLAEQGIELPAELGTSRAGPKAATSRTPARRPRATATPRKTATNPAGKPRGQSNDHRPPQAPSPPTPRLPRIPTLQELLDPIL